MKRKAIAFESALGVFSLMISLATGISLIGKPLRWVDLILILALGVAGGAALTKAIVSCRHHRRQGTVSDDSKRSD